MSAIVVKVPQRFSGIFGIMLMVLYLYAIFCFIIIASGASQKNVVCVVCETSEFLQLQKEGEKLRRGNVEGTD